MEGADEEREILHNGLGKNWEINKTCYAKAGNSSTASFLFYSIYRYTGSRINFFSHLIYVLMMIEIIIDLSLFLDF